MRIRKKYVLPSIVACWLVLVLAVFSTGGAEEPVEFQTILTLEGRPDSRELGRAYFKLNPDENSLHYKISVQNLEDITMAHLHLGKFGDLSSPVVWLYPSSPPPKLMPGDFTGILAEGDITARDLIGPLRGKPLSFLLEMMRREEVYVNIHAKRFAGGEICGQMHCILR